MIYKILIIGLSIFFIGYSQSDFSRYGRDGLFPFYGWRMYNIFQPKQKEASLRVYYMSSANERISCMVPYCSIFNKETNVRLFYYTFKLSDILKYSPDLAKQKSIFLEKFFRDSLSRVIAYEVIWGELDLKYFLTDKKLVTEEKIIFKGSIQ